MAEKEPVVDALSQAEREISLESNPQNIFTIGQRWWSTIVQSGNDPKQIRRLDSMIEQRLIELRELHVERKNPLPKVEKGQYIPPTPRLGERVLWYQANDSTKVFAADVVQIERPGQVQVRLLKAKNDHFAAGDHMLGVRHRADPVHEGGSNQTTVRSGSWDYLVGEKIPDAHYQAARDEIRVREKNTLEAQGKMAERVRATQQQVEAAKAQMPLTV